MYRILLVMVSLSIASIACSLNSNRAVSVSPEPTPITLVVTATPSPTSASTGVTPTATTASSGNAGNGSGSPACSIRTDWPVYIVIQGDTLGNIALRAGTNATALATANCLVNPNSISVGQQLRVPRVPAANTPVPTNSPAKGSIQFSPYLQPTEGGYELEPNTWTTVSWDDYPRGYYGIVEFFLFVQGRDMQRIGSDEDLNNGAQFVWLVPANLRGQIQASFTYAGGVQGGVSYLTTVVSGSAPAAAGFPLISSYIRADNGTFQLRPGETIQIAWQEAPAGAHHVDFIYMLPDGATMVIATDTNMGDGAKIDWVVPSNLNGKLLAYAFNTSNTLLGQSYTHNIYS